MPQLEPVIVLTSWPATSDPAAFAAALVTERLAACVSVLPVMTSTYRWQGALETATEHQVVIKTDRSRVDDLLARASALHPYDVPELLVLTVSGGGRAYLEWLGQSVQP